MTIGGLYVIDGFNVVATLVPEEDVWQFEETETCTTETHKQDGEQESIAEGRATEVRELDGFEVKMEVDESEMRSTPGKKIWSNTTGPKQFSNTMSIVCYGSEHRRIEI